MKTRQTIYDAQDAVGFVKNRENGIIEQAVEACALSERLSKYSRDADFSLLFQFGFRNLLSTFVDCPTGINTDNMIVALTALINSNAYNLETLLDTLDLEYEPLNTISVKELTVTTSTLSAHQMLDKISTSKNVGQDKTNETITDGKGAYSETYNDTENLGKVERAVGTVTTLGARNNSNTDTETKAVYNTDNYNPYLKHSVSETLGAQDNSENVTDQTNPVSNTSNGSKNVTAHTDNITRETTTQPRTDKTVTDARNNENDETKNGNTEKTKTGYENVLPQDTIEKQRALANVNITKCLVQMALETFASGFVIAL